MKAGPSSWKWGSQPEGMVCRAPGSPPCRPGIRVLQLLRISSPATQKHQKMCFLVCKIGKPFRAGADRKGACNPHPETFPGNQLHRGQAVWTPFSALEQRAAPSSASSPLFPSPWSPLAQRKASKGSVVRIPGGSDSPHFSPETAAAGRHSAWVSHLGEERGRGCTGALS